MISCRASWFLPPTKLPAARNIVMGNFWEYPTERLRNSEKLDRNKPVQCCTPVFGSSVPPGTPEPGRQGTTSICSPDEPSIGDKWNSSDLDRSSPWTGLRSG